jgi:hypothetical protein
LPLARGFLFFRFLSSELYYKRAHKFYQLSFVLPDAINYPMSMRRPEIQADLGVKGVKGVIIVAIF